MKHVFITPNPISFLVANKVIDANGLQVDDCLIIYTRNFLPDSREVSVLEMPYGYGDFPWTRRFWVTSKVIDNFDRWVKEIIPDAFCLYLPHGGMPQYQLLNSNPSKHKTFYIEEGSAAYYDNSSRFQASSGGDLFRSNFISKLSYHGRVKRHGLAMFPSQEAGVFGLRKESFPWAREKSILSGVFDSHFAYHAGDYSCILALTLDSSPFWKGFDFQDAVGHLARWLNSVGRRDIGLKSHPGCVGNDTFFSAAKGVLESAGFSVSAVPRDFYLERYLLSGESIVVSMGSSIDIYSDLVSGQVILLGSFLNDAKEYHRLYVSSGPKILEYRRSDLVRSSVSAITL